MSHLLFRSLYRSGASLLARPVQHVDEDPYLPFLLIQVLC